MDIDKIITDALCCDHIKSYPIEDFTIEGLKKLAEKLWLKSLTVNIHAEHSNCYQGVLVQIGTPSMFKEYADLMENHRRKGR